MALAEFWNDVRTRNPLFRNPVSPPHAPRITADDLDTALREKEAAWCPRGTLRGYDEKDFDFLSLDERARLSEWVAAFNADAAELRSLWLHEGNADGKKRLKILTEQAIFPLRNLLLFFAHDRYLSAESFRIGKFVEQELGGQLPEGVVELRFLVGLDWSGDPGVFVWVFLSDAATATDARLAETVNRVSPLLSDTVRRVAPEHFPYISFRGVSERVEEDVAA